VKWFKQPARNYPVIPATRPSTNVIECYLIEIISTITDESIFFLPILSINIEKTSQSRNVTETIIVRVLEEG